ncbi:DNA polymerase III delta prime subunit [Catenuloplanes nepalensis]|uniref:DNA polymerase III delta prime subunit n=1 Tax=Catenuloplanes nepalensis TaxID=587533 RepID=A0ABT9N7T5_9ACTN|nr:AAA domain-containing protein [Catenuloplanes nepalensis]MDP9799593.1 DNA polymerase III delta prime subunit [Catenuloplanes nepalensis]
MTVGLPGPVVLVPSLELPAKVMQQRQQGRQVPAEADLISEINRLNADGGVPATMDHGLRLYVRRHVAGLRPSRHGDAWMMHFVAPMRLSDHERLARGALRLQASGGWFYEPVLTRVPPGMRAFAKEIEYAWRAMSPAEATAPAPHRPASHDAFCDAVEEVVEAGREIRIAAHADAPPIPYYAVESVAEARHDTSAVYVFRLSRVVRLTPGTTVEVTGLPDLRGRVRDLDGDRLRVSFSESIHRPRLPDQGELTATVNLRIPQIQHAAISALRAGRAANPALLPLLADPEQTVAAAAAPGPGATAIDPPASLDPGQREAFRRAVGSPELLLILGPPGTGKSRTIGEIARALVSRGERVLVASQTHVAVDNVLEQLSGGLRAVRVGDEQRVAQSVRHLVVPNLAESVRLSVLDRTAPDMAALQPWVLDEDRPAVLLARLAADVDAARRAEAGHRAAADRHESAIAAVETAFQEPRHAAARALQEARSRLERAEARAAGLAATLAHADARRTGVLGFYHRWRVRRIRDRIAASAHEVPDATRFHAAARTDADVVDGELARLLKEDPAVLDAKRAAIAAAHRQKETVAAARQAAEALRPLLAPYGTLPSTGTEPAGLGAFYHGAAQLDTSLRRRARLLAQWRDRLGEPSTEFNHELVRYADVVGSTCIGVGVERNLIADQTFDVAIIDEAAQIPLASTLVPLVRARRAILVGDHHQLPPVVDDDVRQWLRRRPAAPGGTDPAVLRDLLTTSAFERLHRAGGSALTAALTWQRRMPVAVAEFVSARFYGGALVTKVARTPPDPLLDSCLAVIDTSDLPAADRAERGRKESETWQATGYDNPAEARLIIDLVARYAATRLSWSVIVPYRAQTQYLRARLSELVGNEVLVNDNVGTVDAFQGGERDVVVFGFTRSNRDGRVGFLSELRRLNVAITRARHQLILIGDFDTLRSARDPGFADLARALHAHALAHGVIHPSVAFRAHLREHA